MNFTEQIITLGKKKRKAGYLKPPGFILCVCVWLGVHVDCYISEDLDMTTHQHTEDSKISQDLYTPPHKT